MAVIIQPGKSHPVRIGGKIEVAPSWVLLKRWQNSGGNMTKHFNFLVIENASGFVLSRQEKELLEKMYARECERDAWDV